VILSADTLILKSGQQVAGTYAGGDPRSIRFAIGDQIKTFAVGDVVQMLFGNGENAGGWHPVGQQKSAGAGLTAAGQTTPSSGNRFEGRGAVVYDRKTSLLWQRCSVGQQWNNGSCDGQAQTLTWFAARGLGCRWLEAPHLRGVEDPDRFRT
jgi:hypothetical protein